MPPPSAASKKNEEIFLLALRDIHHHYTARVARQVTLLHFTAVKLLKLQRQIERETRAVAGKEYKELHDVGYTTVRRARVPGGADVSGGAADGAGAGGHCGHGPGDG